MEAAQTQESPPVTHNQTVDADAMVAVTLSKIRRAQEEHASANGTLRNVFAQAEKRGINRAAAKRALKILKSDNRDEAVQEIKDTFFYLRVLGQAVPRSQLDLFETAGGPAPIDEKAAEDGRRAGLMGEAESCPHDLNTDAGKAWLNAYRQGRAERDIVMAMADEDEEAAESEGDEEE